MIPNISLDRSWVLPGPPTETRFSPNMPMANYRFQWSVIPTSSMATFQPALIRYLPAGTVERPAESENAIIARLPFGGPRWTFIAKRHPVEFWSAIIALFVATFVLVRFSWGSLPSITTAAFAQQPSGQVMIIPNWISLQSFVAVLFALILIWLFGMVTWATNETKISFARDNIKQLIGFFGGWITGAAGKAI
jgi:hypothetical protein